MNKLKRVTVYFLGLAVLTLGQRIFVEAGFGAGSFDAFCVGLSGKTGISAGRWVAICSCVMMLVSALLVWKKPCVTVLISSFIFGLLFDMWGTVLAAFLSGAGFYIRVVMYIIGLILAPLGTALYFLSDISKSAFDEFVVAIKTAFRLPLWFAKNACEAMMIAFSLFVGGPIGVTTVITALLFGPFLQKYVAFFEKERVQF